jgi:hypothetical protein
MKTPYLDSPTRTGINSPSSFARAMSPQNVLDANLNVSLSINLPPTLVKLSEAALLENHLNEMSGTHMRFVQKSLIGNK